MTIDEFKERKSALEWNIYALLKEFENECEVGVKYVSLQHVRDIEDKFSNIAFVQVEVEI